MTVFVSHDTAMECWRSGRFDHILGGPSMRPDHRPVGEERVDAIATLLAMDRLSITYAEAIDFSSGDPGPCPVKSTPTAQEMNSAAEGLLAFAPRPLHVLVPAKGAANCLDGVVCHVRSLPLPSGSFVRVDENMLISSPELCFAQMAGTLFLPLLVRLGFELCGLYALRPDGGVDYWRPLPPTTVAAISAYLDACCRVPGAREARKALRFVATASGSPMETVLACMLCLPARFGGYGMPLPLMNYRIERNRDKGADSSLGAGGRGSYYLCDLYWPQAKLDVECDSDLAHTGSGRIAYDAARRNELAALGITTITVTRGQIRSPEKFEETAAQIAHFLGFRLRKDRSWSLEDHAKLLGLLMGR